MVDTTEEILAKEINSSGDFIGRWRKSGRGAGKPPRRANRRVKCANCGTCEKDGATRGTGCLASGQGTALACGGRNDHRENGGACVPDGKG